VSRLDGTAERLRRLVPGYPDAYAVETVVPAGPGWFALDAAPVEDWCGAARGQANPRELASVAAMSVGGALAHAVLGRVTAALALDGVAWDVTAANLVVHRRAEGYLDRLALRDGGRTAPGEPSPGAAPRPGPADGAGPARPAVPPAVLDAVAAAATATLTPLLARVRAATRFGLVPLWNAAADTVRITAAHVPRHAGRPPRDDLAAALLDALVAAGAPIRGRGSAQPLPGRPDHVPVRAACCLFYRTDPPVARRHDALCTTCPLLAPDERARRYAAFLDSLQPSGPVR
jgi:Ferric iron reductase FhuF-like transporter/FhuF 2Fe-2S C-terminal domain